MKTKMDEFIKKLEEKCPNWNIKELENGLEIQQYTNAGEDFSFEAEGSTLKEIADSIYNYYEGFDPEEHVKDWIIAEQSGVKGVPSLFTLVEDSKKLDEDLEDLSIKATEAVNELEKEDEESL